MFGYFNLNNHIYKPTKFSTKELGLMIAPDRLSFGKQAVMYLGVLIGVFFSAAIEQFKKGENINISLSFNTMIISVIVAFIIMPLIYEKLRLNPEAPVLIQFGIFVQNGVFWQVIFSSVN